MDVVKEILDPKEREEVENLQLFGDGISPNGYAALLKSYALPARLNKCLEVATKSIRAGSLIQIGLTSSSSAEAQASGLAPIISVSNAEGERRGCEEQTRGDELRSCQFRYHF